MSIFGSRKIKVLESLILDLKREVEKLSNERKTEVRDFVRATKVLVGNKSLKEGTKCVPLCEFIANVSNSACSESNETMKEPVHSSVPHTVPLGITPPYGFRFSLDKRSIEKHPEEAKVLSLAFKEYRRLGTFEAVCDLINQSSHKPWTVSHLHRAVRTAMISNLYQEWFN